MTSSPIHTAGVIGVGTMGAGIAQILAIAGIRTCLYDAREGAATAAVASIEKQLQHLLAKGKITQQDCAAAVGQLQPVAQLTELADCDVVVEAIVEDLAIKQNLFRELEDVVDKTCVLATNTSSLSVTAVAATCRHPERVAGWHFFNPVPLLRVAEIVDGAATSPEVSNLLERVTQACGHEALRTKDMPGFIVNHAGRAFLPEGLRLLAEQVAAAVDIDRVLVDCAGFKMGPFALMDTVGLDVAQKVVDSLYRQYFEEPRFKSSPVVASRVAAGLLGRKSGRGFYQYEEGRAVIPPEHSPESPETLLPSLWIWNEEADLSQTLREALINAGADVETGDCPSASALIVVTPVGSDVSTTCALHGFPPERTVGVDMLFATERRRTIMAPPGLGGPALAAARYWLSKGVERGTVIADSPGFIAQRMVAQIINIGCDIAQMGIATPQAIDRAVCKALGYPLGPFAWGDALGGARVLQITEALHSAYQEPRYRPSIWLRRRAQLGLSLSQAC